MAFIQTNNIKGDIFGGITAGIVALPLALAFGIQAFGGVNDPAASSIGALAGIVGATMLGFFAALFGGTHSQISGPTGPMTVVAATLVGGAWASSGGSISEVLISMSLAGVFCGLFQILFGAIKLGDGMKYLGETADRFASFLERVRCRICGGLGLLLDPIHRLDDFVTASLVGGELDLNVYVVFCRHNGGGMLREQTKREDKDDGDDGQPDNQGLGFAIVLRRQFLDDVVHGA